MERKWLSIAVLALTIIFLVGTGFLAVKKTVVKVHQPAKEILVVGTNPPFPPFEVRKGDEIIGFDMDLMEKVAKKLGRRIVIKTFTEFDALLPSLLQGEIDIAASSVTITPQRDEIFDFSMPYYNSAQAVLAKKTSQLRDLTRPEDFVALSIGYQKGTTSQSWIENNLLAKVKIYGCTVFDDLNYGLQLLKFRDVHIIILDKPVAQRLAQLNPDLEVVGILETGEQYGLVVKQGDPNHLLPVVNQVIKEMQETGEYQKLIDKWFGGEK